MIRRLSNVAAVVTTIVLLGSTGPARAADPPQGTPADLKVTRVAVFSSGVAFFERAATVNGAATAELKFRSEQINDMLKSLVVQDLDGGSVGVVSYASKVPLDRTLESFAVDLTGDPSMAELLAQLRGEPVEIAGPRQTRGTIVGVEEHEIVVDLDQPAVTVHYVNILTDEGIQQLRLDQLRGIKLTNEKIAAEMRKALAALAGGNDTDKKSVAVRFDGQGERRVRASFLLEAPIWKTSYRLVLGAEQQPFLQGWAMVENATEEDWDQVRLSLVSGRPISFQMDLYTPIYIPRPVEDLDLYASLRAPDFDAGINLGMGMGGGMGLPDQHGRRKMESSSRGEEARARQESPKAMPEPTARVRYKSEDKSLERLGETGVASAADSHEAGELFEYVIKTPVSIARQNSAMLPIVNENIAGQKVSIYNPSTHRQHPLNGLLIENTSGLNLMQGPVTVFDSGVYAGDAKLPDLKPGEKRLLAYALDLSMDMLIDKPPTPDELVSLRIGKGVLYHQHRYVDGRTYTARNKDQKDRTLIIEQDYSSGWTLLEPKEPYERTQNLFRFKVEVPAGKQVQQTVKLERVLEQSVALSEIGLDAVQVYLKATVISPAVKAAMEKVVALRTELDRLGRERAASEQDVKEAVAEQARVRENLKTIQQNTDTYQRQLKKFDTLETQIEQYRDQAATLRQQEESQRQALEQYLLGLDVQ